MRTTDSGKTWDFVSWIGPEPEGFSIMPASVRLSETDILVTVRMREETRRWISDLPVNRQRRQLGVPERGGA